MSATVKSAQAIHSRPSKRRSSTVDTGLLTTQYGKEIWKLYESGDLTPQVELTGRFKASNKVADVRSIMREIKDARDEAMQRRYERED
jgi:RIO kinase 1